MNCPYCRAKNESDDHRCSRCGRRLVEMARPAVIHGNAAPALHAEPRIEDEVARPRPALHVVPAAAAPVEKQGPAYQASLFGPRAVESHAPPPRKHPVQTRSRQDRSSAARDRQAFFDFDAPDQTASDTPHLDAPIAPTALRVIASGVDLTVGLAGTVLFAVTLRVMGNGADLGSKTTFFYGGTCLLIMLFYRLLFCLASTDTPGCRWTGLRLMNFDGHRPTRRQRFQRLAGSCVSVLAVGLGLIWALFDEHKLTWHDYISGTFTTLDMAAEPRRR